MAAGCSKSGGSGSATGAKDSLVVATMSEPPSVGPYDHNAVAGDYVNNLVFARLFRTDADLNPEPWLVDTYENTDRTYPKLSKWYPRFRQ